MGRNDWERKGRIAHRWLAIGAVGFLLVSVITGLLWANARFLYWEDQYKEKLHALPRVSLHQATLQIKAVEDRVYALTSKEAAIEQLTLKSDFGRLVYEVRARAANKKHVLLIDAMTGEAISPISDDLASIIARQYVREEAPVSGIRTESYIPRKKHTSVDAVRVSFDDSNQTHIILDRNSGEIIEDEGRWRRFHFFVMQLHQLNFFGFEKTLLNIPGVPLLLMALSGAVLWSLHLRRTRRARRTTVPAATPTREKVFITGQEHG
jgi:uncharacterized membrane protein YkoI